MMHKAWNKLGEVPYCFLRSSIKFQDGTGQKIADFDPNWTFPDRNSGLNLSMATKWCTKLEVGQERRPIFSRSFIKFEGHTGQKIADFEPNWAYPDCKSSLNSPMALKWCTLLDVVLKRCRLVFLGHPSNFKITWEKIDDLNPILIKITRPVTAIKSLRFALF